MPNWEIIRREIRQLRESVAPHRSATPDPARWDWYAPGCPCGALVGQCREHPRARAAQRPPAGDWRVWGYIAGRGAGKTRAGACWVHDRVGRGIMREGALIAPTAADIRDVMVEGPSGILATASPLARPRFEPSKRRVTWPNGARAVCLTGEEPERARGLNLDTVWADELACWRRAEATWDLTMLALRAGVDPRAMVTTTPRRVPVLKRILGQRMTVQTSETTYANQAHLPREFVDQIVGLYEGTNLGRQEIYAELLETAEGAWFARSWDARVHLSVRAEYDPRFPVCLAIDAGVSAHHAAVWYQVRPGDALASRAPGGWLLPADARGHDLVTVFGDYHSQGLSSAQAASAIHSHGCTLPGGGRLDSVRLDPYGVPSTGMGITAYGEFARVFGSGLVGRWPQHRVLDGLDQIEVLLDLRSLVVHPRCLLVVDAFANYAHGRSAGGHWLDRPADPQHPHEDLMDALRGGIRDRFPGGRVEPLGLRTVRGY